MAVNLEREGKTLSDSAEFTRSDYGSALAVPPDEAQEQQDQEKLGKFWWLKFSLPRRYYLVILAFFGFFNVYAMRVNLSVAVLYINTNRTIHLRNGTTIEIPPQFPHLDNFKVGVVLSSFFYGYIITQIPGGWLACRFGGKLIFGAGILVSGLMALITPLAVHSGFWFLIFVRVVQGFFQGASYPSMMAVLSHWAPLKEKTILATVAVSGAHFGTALALPLSAALAEKFGWPSIFYFFGILALLWVGLWLWTVGETPYADKRIQKSELKYITSSVGYTFEQVQLLHDDIDNADDSDDDVIDGFNYLRKINKNHYHNVAFKSAVSPPWKSILTSGPVWAIIASHFSENWGFYTMLTELPMFLNRVFTFSMAKTGFLSALPYLVLGVSGLVAGFLADYLRTKRKMETLLVRKLFNCVAMAIQAVFILGAAHASSGSMAVTCIVIAIGLGGFVWSAFAVNQLDIAPQYAGVLMGLSNTVATIPGIIGPSVVGALVVHNYVTEWQLVFYIIVSIYIFGTAIYAIFASADRQPWAEVSGGAVMTLDDES